LSVALGNYLGFISFNRIIIFKLDFVNPFAADLALGRREINYSLGIIQLKSLDLFRHGFTPFGMLDNLMIILRLNN
jgi:hypothetical protein